MRQKSIVSVRIEFVKLTTDQLKEMKYAEKENEEKQEMVVEEEEGVEVVLPVSIKMTSLSGTALDICMYICEYK
jgi:hypothetical protein